MAVLINADEIFEYYRQ